MSTVKANDITNVAGSIPTVKGQQLIPTAWVNFNGTGTVAIRDSEGVSSIGDNGTGDYYVNFTTAMADINYAVALGGNGGSAGILGASTSTTTSVRLYQHSYAGTQTDVGYNNVVILGGQA